MMKKILAALLCAALLFALAACSGGSGNGDTTDTGSDTKGGDNKKNIKIGVILIGDENEGYTYAHIEGIKEAMKENNISEDQVVWKYNIPENEQCKETAEDLAEQGCTAIFSNSYNHQTHMQQVAGEPGYEDITFVSATGDTAANSGLKNFKNCFTKVYESRYVSGIVAGMKLAELVKDGKIADSNKDADGNIKIGYVGAYPYAEVVSGYTAFYLGIKSVIENVVMEVQYTQSWFDIAAEGQAAKALMADGCIIIGQHADSTGAPAEMREPLLTPSDTMLICSALLRRPHSLPLPTYGLLIILTLSVSFSRVRTSTSIGQRVTPTMPLRSPLSASPALKELRRRLTRQLLLLRRELSMCSISTPLPWTARRLRAV